MLAYRGMYRNAFRDTAVCWLTCLLVLPNSVAFAGTLREEAISYRVQGFEAQRRGDTASALSLYQKAAALDPAYPTPLNDMGVLLEGQGRLEEAGGAYQKALSLNPNYLEAHANLAMLYERTGQKEKAIFHWLKRYELGDANDPWTSRAEERLVALGVLKDFPGVKGRRYTRKHTIESEFREHDKTMEEFQSVTDKDGPWP